MIKNLYEVYQFKISLNEIKPIIWRRIVVPSTYSFWDLHVAIQDSMGWLDYHLHEFDMINPFTSDNVKIGIPDEDYQPGDRIVLPGHKEKIANYFTIDNSSAVYEYDFGDSWIHSIKLEKITQAVIGENYPKCTAGKMKCPPEDCGGTEGYRNVIKILNNPKNKEYEEMVEWTGGHFDSKEYDPSSVIFDNPKERFKKSGI